MTDLATLSAGDLLALYRSGEASPVEATEAALARAHAAQETHNPFVFIDDDAALAAARASEARWKKDAPAGPADGVPTTLKDLVLTKGRPTLKGSKTIDPDQPWEEDAPVTARLKESGAVILGKTTTPEMGWKGVTDSPLTGITCNPWDATKTPGGSSGGAAAAAGLCAGALHVGSDGGGSVRIPAAFSGIFGHKTTFARVAAWPLSPFGTLANVGPMTRTVTDSAILLNVIGRPDWRDWYSDPRDKEDYLSGLDDGVAGLKIAYSPTLCGHHVEPGVADAVKKAVDQFADFGAIVEEAEPDIGKDTPGATFMTHWWTVGTFVVQSLSDDQRALMDPGLLEVAERGARFTSTDMVNGQMARRTMGTAINGFFENYDLLLTPSVPLTAFETGTYVPPQRTPDERAWVNWTPFSYPFNLSRHPACSVPCGFSDGLPVGLQIVGRHFEDNLVLRAARAYEKANPIQLPPG